MKKYENRILREALAIAEGDPTVKVRRFMSAGEKCILMFSDGLVSSQLISDSVVKPLSERKEGERANLEYIASDVIEAADIKVCFDEKDMRAAVCGGDAVLFVEGRQGFIFIGTKSFATRSVNEPDDEKVSKGSREGFVESIMTNIGLLKRRLKSGKLRIEMISIGEKTGTSCCICYLEGTADKEVLRKVRKQLSDIRTDGILSSNYISELITPAPFALFRRIGVTARPDVLAAKLLEGRVGIMTDGCPQALTVPFIFLEHFQSPDDYYTDYHIALFSRVLRMAGFVTAVLLAPLYIAVLNYHPGTLTTKMIINIALTQEATPFSAAAEAVILLLSFDLLREAGLRTPSNMGQALSIVGALVLGQSAVEANIVSPSMVIVAALSGVSGLIVNELKNQITVIRLGLLFLSQYAGLWGCVMGLIAVFGRLAETESFGADYMGSMPFTASGSHEDSIMRTPMRFMKKSGRFISRS